MGISMSLIEIGPFVAHYISWRCPMQRNSSCAITNSLQRRDQRIAEDNGVRWPAKHMYTFGLSALDEPIKMNGNVEHYKEAEKKFASS